MLVVIQNREWYPTTNSPAATFGQSLSHADHPSAVAMKRAKGIILRKAKRLAWRRLAIQPFFFKIQESGDLLNQVPEGIGAVLTRRPPIQFHFFSVHRTFSRKSDIRRCLHIYQVWPLAYVRYLTFAGVKGSLRAAPRAHFAQTKPSLQGIENCGS
jgi:hypothetical protein